MRYLLVSILSLIILASCGTADIQKITPGMDQSQVIDIMGNPDDVMQGALPDTAGGGTYEVTIWQYGANQGVVLYGGKVELVIPDLDKFIREMKAAGGQ